MARKKESSFEMLLEVVAYFPWWVGLIGALLTYPLLHHYTQVSITPMNSLADAGSMVQSQFIKTFATLGQYVLPMIFTLGAIISFFKRKQRVQLFEQSANAPTVGSLSEPSWQEFEMLVGEAFRRKGYSVRETGGGGADGGVDLVLSKDGKNYLVQCKQWKTRQVGVKPVRELAGLVATHGASGGVMVSSGNYTEEAKDFAKQSRISLIAGEQLHALIKTVSKQQFNELTTKSTAPLKSSESIQCPHCGSPMVKREAKQGPNSGKHFLGCSNYPKCRGTRAIA